MNATINIFLTAFIVVMCFVFAYFVACTDLLIDTLKGTKRSVFIGIMLLYGSFRAYRLYKQIQQLRTPQDED